MEEQNSDDETLEFEIEVVSSSSSCLSLNAQDENQPPQINPDECKEEQVVCVAEDKEEQRTALNKVEQTDKLVAAEEENRSKSEVEDGQPPRDIQLVQSSAIEDSQQPLDAPPESSAPQRTLEASIVIDENKDPANEVVEENQIEQLESGPPPQPASEEINGVDISGTESEQHVDEPEQIPLDLEETNILRNQEDDKLNSAPHCEQHEQLDLSQEKAVEVVPANTSIADLNEPSEPSGGAALQCAAPEETNDNNQAAGEPLGLESASESAPSDGQAKVSSDESPAVNEANNRTDVGPVQADDPVDDRQELEPIGWSLVGVTRAEPVENGWLMVENKTELQLSDVDSTSIHTTAEPERVSGGESETDLLNGHVEADPIEQQIGAAELVTEIEQQATRTELEDAALTTTKDQSTDNNRQASELAAKLDDDGDDDKKSRDAAEPPGDSGRPTMTKQSEKIDIEVEFVRCNLSGAPDGPQTPGLAALRKPRLSFSEDNEDLEREFDEEPEFERRQVVVKRAAFRNEYQLGDELGRGRFGTVSRCTELSSGRQLAAKFVHLRRREDRADVEREIAIMSLLQHKRLLQLYDAFDDGRSEMCLVTELVDGGELFERIVDDDFELTEKKAAIFMRQICEGVDYMQSQRIVHLDMKPENILCLSRTSNRIKLIDFGLARRLEPDEPLRVMFGTPDFAAPEVLNYETVSLATDMWSVGVICYVLLSGLSPFMGDNDMETMANVMRATFDFEAQAFEPISDLAKDFISKLLIREPSERLKPAECLQHAWLQRGGAQLEAAVRERRESIASIVINNTHQFQAAAVSTPPADGGGAASPTVSLAETTSSLVSLDKRNLKRYVVRRKWHKTVHAIMALGRMGANLKSKL